MVSGYCFVTCSSGGKSVVVKWNGSPADKNNVKLIKKLETWVGSEMKGGSWKADLGTFGFGVPRGPKVIEWPDADRKA